MATHPRLALALVAATFLAAACGSPVGPTERDSIEAWMDFHDVPGVSVAVIKGFRVAYVEQYGVKSLTTGEPVTAETLFQAASLSKGVGAVAVLTLVRDRIVSLDLDVRDYLTSWTLPYQGVPSSEVVTLRHLLSHTGGTTVSGFRGYRYTEEVPTLIQLLNGEPPANSAPVVVSRKPGDQFSYSGGGYEVMQQALQDVTGQRYPDLVRERVLAPVGMTRSTFEHPIPDSLRDRAASGYYANGVAVPGGHHIYPEMAAGGLWTTPADLALFLIEIQNALGNGASRVLSRASAETLLTEVKRDYGLGFDLWSNGGQPYFGHNGANDGFRCAMIAHRTSGDGVVILTNSDRGSDLYPDLIRLIAEREGWPGY